MLNLISHLRGRHNTNSHNQWFFDAREMLPGAPKELYPGVCVCVCACACVCVLDGGHLCVRVRECILQLG